MTTAERIVAIDVGTQSVRALLVGPDGTIHGAVRVPIEPYVSPHPGWAEQDPDVHWRAIGEACRRLLAATPTPADAIAAATLTTQRGTVVVTDEAGRPLRPAMVWLDDRRTSGLPPFGGVRGPTAVAFRRTLGMFATGVTVLTTRVGEQVHGMTANAFMSVSLQPPLVLISIDRRAKMGALLHEGTRFGVSVLEAKQTGLSDRFAGRVGDELPEATFEVIQVLD